MYAIETFGITKNFDYKKQRIRALENVSIKIGKGQIYGLLGPNGAGKTTLINILTTLITPTSGNANVLGFDLLKEPDKIRERTGLCYGGSRFYWDFNLMQILRYYGMIFGIPRDKYERKIRELIKDLGMQQFKDRSYNMLSTGMKQKVAIAKSLLNEPEFIFMDEPTIGLDVDVSIDVRNYLHKLVKEGNVAMLLTSHNMHEVEVLCKNIALINKGKIIEEGGIKDIKKRLKFPDTIYLKIDAKKIGFLKSINGVNKLSWSDDGIFIETYKTQDVLDRILNQLKKRRIELQDIEIRKATLEDAFLKIVGD